MNSITATQESLLANLQATVEDRSIRAILLKFFTGFSIWRRSDDKTLESYYNMYVHLKAFAAFYGKNPDEQPIGGLYGILEEIVLDALQQKIDSEEALNELLKQYQKKLRKFNVHFDSHTFAVNVYGEMLDPISFPKQWHFEPYKDKMPRWVDKRWNELKELQQQHVREVYAYINEHGKPLDNDSGAAKRYRLDKRAYTTLTSIEHINPQFKKFLDKQFAYLLEHPDRMDALYADQPKIETCPLIYLRHSPRAGHVWLHGYTVYTHEGIATRMICQLHPTISTLMQKITGKEYLEAKMGEVTATDLKCLFEKIKKKEIQCVVLTEQLGAPAKKPPKSEVLVSEKKRRKISPLTEAEEPSLEAAAGAHISSFGGARHAVERVGEPFFQELFSVDTEDFFLAEALAELARVHAHLSTTVRKKTEALHGEIWPEARLKKQIEALPDHSVPHQPILAYKLKPYQVAAVAANRRLLQHNLAGLLALDAGLGKTLICLNHIFEHVVEHPADTRPILVLCPKMLVPQWHDACSKELAQLAARDARPVFKKRNFALSAESPAEVAAALERKPAVLFTTPSSILQLPNAESLQFSWLIIDEADRFITNHNEEGKGSKLQMLFDKWPNQKRLLVTATPIRNSITDVWKLFELVNGVDEEGRVFFNQLLHYKETFMKWLIDVAMEREVDIDRVAVGLSRLHERILYLRKIVHPLAFVAKRDDPRIRDDWNNQIPTLIRKTCQIELNARQKSLLAGALKTNKLFTLYDNESKVKQHPDLFQEGSSRLIEKESQAFRQLVAKAKSAPQEVIDGSPLWQKMMKKLQKRLQAGKKVLIVCHHIVVQELLKELVAARFAQLNVRVELVNGDTKREKRAILERFKKEQVRPSVLLLINKSGGVGLDCPDATTMFALGEQWNDGSREQVESRHVRVGVGGEKEVLYFHANLQHEKHMRDTSAKKRLWADIALSAPPTREGLLADAEKIVEAAIKELLALIMNGEQLSEAQRGRLEAFCPELLRVYQTKRFFSSF